MRRPGLWTANGEPDDTAQMYSWRPGAIACMYQHLASNDVFNYKVANPDVPVIVRFQHPQQWLQDPSGTARQLGRWIAGKWDDLKPLDPYVYFASHLNMHYQNGDPNPANQRDYMSPEFYKKYADWVRATADVIKYIAPDMRLVTPPLAFGFNEDGSPDADGNPILGWAGYDYLHETIRDYFDNILTFHAYWGYPSGGSVPDWLYEPELSSWYAFRWQRLLQLFQSRYGLNARLIIDEAASFGPADPDFTDQLIYYARQCLSDSRVIALAYYLWADTTNDPRAQLNSWATQIPALGQHLQRLAEMPDVTSSPAIASVDEALDLTGILDFPEPAQLADEEATKVQGHTIRVLFEDGSVKVMPLEQYLRSVVPGEMPAMWPEEALKVQAVASRSYAQYAIEHPRHRPQADICTTTHCQHFDSKRIHDRADAAIQQTQGLILRYQGNTVNAVFHARCGGHTKNNEEVWTKGSPRPFLRGVPCPDKAEKFGHGVGFCQHGARVFAEQGRNFADILTHYYRGVTVESLYK